jgi:hypothetical protein
MIWLDWQLGQVMERFSSGVSPSLASLTITLHLYPESLWSEPKTEKLLESGGGCDEAET